MADDLNDLFIEALKSMKGPVFAQDRKTRAPVVYEPNPLKKHDIQGVNPKDVVAFNDPEAQMNSDVIKTAYGNMRLPKGVISVDPKRLAKEVKESGGSTMHQYLSHEAVHQTLFNARGGQGIPDWDNPIMDKLKLMSKKQAIGDLDSEIPAYVATQPWRIPGMTPELRKQFLDGYTEHVRQYDPVAAKRYQFLTPNYTTTADPREWVDSSPSSPPVPATSSIGNLEDNQ